MLYPKRCCPQRHLEQSRALSVVITDCIKSSAQLAHLAHHGTLSVSRLPLNLASVTTACPTVQVWPHVSPKALPARLPRLCHRVGLKFEG